MVNVFAALFSENVSVTMVNREEDELPLQVPHLVPKLAETAGEGLSWNYRFNFRLLRVLRSTSCCFFGVRYANALQGF